MDVLDGFAIGIPKQTLRTSRLIVDYARLMGSEGIITIIHISADQYHHSVWMGLKKVS